MEDRLFPMRPIADQSTCPHFNNACLSLKMRQHARCTEILAEDHALDRHNEMPAWSPEHGRTLHLHLDTPSEI